MPATFTFGLSLGRNSASRPTCSATAIPASHNVSSSVVVSPLSAPCSVTATTAPVSRSTACSALCARCVRPSFIFAIRASSSAGLFHSLFDVRFLRLRSNRARSSRVGVAIPEAFASPAQKLLVTRPRIPPHNRAHRCVGFQRRRINRDPLSLQHPAIGQHPQHPTEYFTMRIEVDQSSRARDRRVVRRVLVQRNAHKAPQRQRVRQPPGNPPLRPDTLEIPDQQRSKVNPRRQRRTPVLLRIKLRAPLLDELVEALGLQQLIQALIKRVSRSRRQLAVRDPDVLLLLPLLARPHRHAPILQTKPVDTSTLSVHESGLAPRAPKLAEGFLDSVGLSASPPILLRSKWSVTILCNAQQITKTLVPQ